MCELCSCDPVVKGFAVTKNKNIAERLDALSKRYMQFANVEIKPHDEQAKIIAANARSLIVELVTTGLNHAPLPNKISRESD